MSAWAQGFTPSACAALRSFLVFFSLGFMFLHSELAIWKTTAHALCSELLTLHTSVLVSHLTKALPGENCPLLTWGNQNQCSTESVV